MSAGVGRGPVVGDGVAYGRVEVLAPGAVDPVLLAAYDEGVAHGWVNPHDPADAAVSTPLDGVDLRAEFPRLFADDGDPNLGADSCGAAAADPPVASLPAAARPAVDPPGTRPVAVDSPAAAPLAAAEAAVVEVPRVLPAAVADMAPGPELAGVLDGVDVAELGAFELVEAAAAWQRLTSWALAAQAGVLAELTRRTAMRPAGDTGYRSVNPVTNTAMDVAGRTHTTTRQAENAVGHAVQLVEDFPATHAALAAGMIDERRARVITAELGGQDPAIRRRVEASVLPEAGDLDSVLLRRKVKHLLQQLAPVEAEQRCQQARQRRYVRDSPAEDGMAHLEAFMPAEDVAAVMATLNAAAETAKRRDRESSREPRTLDQRRADALAELVWNSLTTGHLGARPDVSHGNNGDSGHDGHDDGHDDGHGDGSGGGRRDADGHDRHGHAGGTASPGGAPVGTALAHAHGRPVTVHVTIPLTTLLGLDEHPAHLDGYGPVPGQIGRHLAAGGLWQWVGTHPATGQVLDHGLTRYRPPQALIDHVVLRDRECRSPGCHRPAMACEIDHRDPHSRGGPTSACNCLPLCKTHHLLKHHGRWRLVRLQSGAYEWISPSGHRYTKPPESIGPITGTHPDVEPTGVGPPRLKPPPSPVDPTVRADPPGPCDDVPPF
ncbi:uncharacterized protein DUF222 [Haloactinopolyspora alba]|uniref:Uncharacterized protein DUF222 n=1 Tax=Haloactinopolyspora alba TaxID=648780 RepID=A0A2P8E6Z9_9ACTN|nr:uncharacterized protein DUF222 [Haloactinopolyspora alba]